MQIRSAYKRGNSSCGKKLAQTKSNLKHNELASQIHIAENYSLTNQNEIHRTEPAGFVGLVGYAGLAGHSQGHVMDLKAAHLPLP